MDLKETYTALIADLKTKSKEVSSKIKELTAGLEAEKAVYDGQIKQLEAGKKLLDNPAAVKKTRAKK